jgi:hypothetical protein
MKRFLPAVVIAIVACTASAHPIESSADVQQGSYVKYLEKHFGSHLHYDGRESREAIANFMLDCHSNDGRVMPLKHALLLGLSEANYWPKNAKGAPPFTIEYYVETRQGETRVLSAHSGESEGTVLLEIDKWGTLHSQFVEAYTNACYQSPEQGAAWVYFDGTAPEPNSNASATTGG